VSRPALALVALAACASGSAIHIDRFSDTAAHLMKRSANPALPRPDQPIDLSHAPFSTQGFAPDGSIVRYYNFDVQRDRPATLWRLMQRGRAIGDVVDALPGDPTYSDFWRVAVVDVPDGVAITSAADIRSHQLAVRPDTTVLDCPIVPRGTIADAATVTELWYRGARVTCLRFDPPLAATETGAEPTSPIFVTFHGAGPPSGFQTAGSIQTHNVVMSVPGDTDYSPLWAVHVYDRAAFDRVHDAASAEAAPLLDAHGPLVNCPIYFQARTSSAVSN
jgi:hypothetical protein